MNTKPVPPKLWEIAFVIVGSLICIIILTKMVRDLDKPRVDRLEQIRP